MADLSTAARKLEKAVAELNVAVAVYVATAVNVGRESQDPTARGLSTVQIQKKLSSFIVARLSAHAPGVRPVLRFEGGPEAVKFARAHPLPGL